MIEEGIRPIERLKRRHVELAARDLDRVDLQPHLVLDHLIEEFLGRQRGGLGLAVVRDAAILAALAALGAYLTPALASTGGGGRDALFGYLAVLDLGVLVVAARRRWRGLEAVASLGTWALFAAWYHATATPGVITLAGELHPQ